MNIKAFCPPSDMYEENDTFKNAYDFKVNFLTNTVNINTEGASCHKSEDYDFYSITLPKGSNYVISGKLIDYPSLDNNETQCTLDAIISYTIDTGKTWLKVFDNTITNSISLKNGGKVYFLVVSKKLGEIGTYFIDLTVVKSPILSAAKNITQFTTSGIIGKATIDTINATVKMVVSSSTDITNLAPVITISKFASINSASGTKLDFSMPVQYTVQAQDGSTRIWTVSIEKKSASVSNAKMEASFSVLPNPAHSQITIKAEHTPDNLPYAILDAIGRKVYSGNLNDSATMINIENLGLGVYYLKIEGSRNQYIRFIVN